MQLNKSQVVSEILELLEQGYTRIPGQANYMDGKSIQEHFQAKLGDPEDEGVRKLTAREVKSWFDWPELKGRKTRITNNLFEIVDDDAADPVVAESDPAEQPVLEDVQEEAPTATEQSVFG